MPMRKTWTFALAAAIAGTLAGCGESAKPAEAATTGGTATPTANATPKPGPVTELKKEDLIVGKGEAAASGDMVYVLYEGKLADGMVFDSTATRGNEPFTFQLGAGSVIKGWDQGLVGMKPGGKRKLSIPYALAYGDKDNGKIPPKSDLFFEIELLELLKQGEENTVVRETVKEGSGREVKKGDTVSITYVGTLPNGNEFDSTKKHGGKPFSFKVGSGQVIPGFDLAVMGMKKGGQRKVKIPPTLGYGFRPMPGIPQNSILKFDITLVDVK